MDDVVDRQDFERRNMLQKQEANIQVRKLTLLYLALGMASGMFLGFLFALAFAVGFLSSLVH